MSTSKFNAVSPSSSSSGSGGGSAAAADSAQTAEKSSAPSYDDNLHITDAQQRTVCRGFLLGNDDPGRSIPGHFSSRRDKYCTACVAKHGLGVRAIDTSRIRIVQASAIAQSRHNCQVGQYQIAGSQQCPSGGRSPHSAAAMHVRKRHYVHDSHGRRAPVLHLEFVDANGTALPAVPVLVAVEAQEVGGSSHHNNYSAGTSRVPPKHCGEGASLVIVFSSPKDAESFTAAFKALFTVDVTWLEPGLERFIFDAKRAAFAPYCSILQRTAGPEKLPACSQCVKIRQRDLCLDGDRPVPVSGTNDITPAKDFTPTCGFGLATCVKQHDPPIINVADDPPPKKTRLDATAPPSKPKDTSKSTSTNIGKGRKRPTLLVGDAQRSASPRQQLLFRAPLHTPWNGIAGHSTPGSSAIATVSPMADDIFAAFCSPTMSMDMSNATNMMALPAQSPIDACHFVMQSPAFQQADQWAAISMSPMTVMDNDGLATADAMFLGLSPSAAFGGSPRLPSTAPNSEHWTTTVLQDGRAA
jgi:hypothetical protein